MTSVGLEPLWYNDLSLPLDHMLVVDNISQLVHHNLFLLTCIINIRHISSHKMTSVTLEPHGYFTQPVVFTTIPLARCWKPTATYSS
jgi:hypothetical protein